MPRDMTGTGRYPPRPRYKPFAFYSCARLGDPEMMARIMSVDPYYVTQDNGGGAPIHFAVTYNQLDMVHHLLNNGAEINQRDRMRGYTPLHRAAIVAHYQGGLEMYEYLLSRGADPAILCNDYDPYLNPGFKSPVEEAVDDIQADLQALEERYKDVPKVPEPHEDVGDFWALYDYGFETVRSWDKEFKPAYPELLRNIKEKARKAAAKVQRHTRRLALARGEVLQEVPRSSICFLFPGQGSQSVGMLESAKDLPAVQKLARTAESVLGYDILEICLQGPKIKLDDTTYSQPALLLAGLAAVEQLREDSSSTVDQCSAAAGLSLGEYTALVFAGAMTFEDALKVVKVRAEAMSAAGKAGEPHGMLSVVGLDDDILQGITKAVRSEVGPEMVCEVTNRLFPQGRVISGHHKALDKAMEKANEAGALKVQKVAVSGAFHTSLMDAAREALSKILQEVEIKEPRIPVISNVTGRPFEGADEIRALLQRQVIEPVMWEDTLMRLVDDGKTEVYEVGPGKQIKAMMKRVDGNVWRSMKNVQV